jgi:hypothetical protein
MELPLSRSLQVNEQLDAIDDLERILSRPNIPRSGPAFIIPEGHLSRELFPNCSHKVDSLGIYISFLYDEARNKELSFEQVLADRAEEAIRNIIVAFEEPLSIGPERDFSYGVFDKYGTAYALKAIAHIRNEEWEDAEKSFHSLFAVLTYR